MNRHYFLKEDKRGRLLYDKIVTNKEIEKDYFEDKKDSLEELENLFSTNRYYFSNTSEEVKIKILYSLKKYNLTIYEYFDLIELFFNKYYYGLVLEKNDENKLKKYFTF